jgi:hypothetical protein
VSFKLSFDAPPRAAPSADLYDLAEAGAAARIELDGYELPLDGTGVVELAKGCRSLLAIIEGGEPAPADEELRPELPHAPTDAVLHQWLFSSFMLRIPVLIFAVTPETTWIATRTHEEAEGWPLVVLEGRDLADPVTVPTADVETEARGYLAAAEPRAL